MSDNIPFDIQLEIIKRVPHVKSLIRFRSVSKPWKCFIDSSEFITSYGACDTKPHRLLLRYETTAYPREVKYLSFVDDVSFPQQQQDFAPNVPLLVKQLNYSKVIGSSYGLWCLHGYKDWPTEMVVIWNPSARKSVGIVVPCDLLTYTSRKFYHFGFGVCHSTNDPTIVGISKDPLNMTWQAGIFTLGSKTWKIILSSNMRLVSAIVESSTQVATTRFIFWLAYDKIIGSCDVLSFDLITHEFKKLNLHNSLMLSVLPCISKLKESLVVSAYIVDVNEQVYQVWMMGEEGGVMTSFTKLFNIMGNDLLVTKVLGYRKSGEPIMETQYELELTKIKVYDPCSKHVNDFGITGVKGSFFICPYTETLLLTDYSDGCLIPTTIENENDWCMTFSYDSWMPIKDL